MAEEEKINEQTEENGAEAAELRQMILELNERIKTVEKENKELRSENRKYFYDSLNTGLKDEPEAEPEPQPTILDDKTMQENLKTIIKGAY